MFDRLPTPFGLVRAGVAPDHPKIKSVIRVYEKTAAREGFRFFGNVEVGRDVTVAELSERYNAVVYAYGSCHRPPARDPGRGSARLARRHRVRRLVQRPPGLRRPPSSTSPAERAVVIGNGNVAADVARMLALPRDELDTTDTADHAIDPLADSGVREIVVLGRRGPAQAAFTNPEVRELGEMTIADVIVDPAEVELDEVSREFVDSEECDPTNRRNVEIFTDFSGREPEGKPKRISLRFCARPSRSRATGGSRASCSRSTSSTATRPGRSGPATPASARSSSAASCCARSATRGVPLEGLPFDERRAVIANEGGRVIDADSGEQVPGQYVVGWIKRGPSGVIGTNKKDAQETVGGHLRGSRSRAASCRPRRPRKRS